VDDVKSADQNYVFDFKFKFTCVQMIDVRFLVKKDMCVFVNLCRDHVRNLCGLLRHIDRLNGLWCKR